MWVEVETPPDRIARYRPHPHATIAAIEGSIDIQLWKKLSRVDRGGAIGIFVCDRYHAIDFWESDRSHQPGSAIGIVS